MVELDQRTGEVLDAIEKAGIKDKTMVIFVSDNGSTATGGSLDELYAGDAGPFRGELGDAQEDSIRTVGMVRWPGKIKPSVTNEMIAIHCSVFDQVGINPKIVVAIGCADPFALGRSAAPALLTHDADNFLVVDDPTFALRLFG